MTEPTAIDIHAHVLVPAVEEIIAPHFRPSLDPFLAYGGKSNDYNRTLYAGLRPRLTDVDLRLADMDRQGVACQVLSIAPAQYHYWADRRIAERLVAVQNEAIADVVAARPDRLIGLGSVAMQLPDLAARQLDQVAALGLRGVAINPSAQGRDYDEPAYAGFWSEVSARQLPVMLHPNGYSDGARLTEHYLINVIGNPLETTVALSHIILGGVLERHPSLKIVAVHGGGYLPFYAERMDHAHARRPDVSDRLSRPPSTYLRQIYYDSVVFGGALWRLLDTVGPEHVLLGSDYPFDMGDPEPVERIRAQSGLGEAELALVLRGNAARLLGLPVDAPSAVPERA